MSFANKQPGRRILPARRLIPQANPSTQFKKISSAINEIYKHNASQLSFEELYRTAYSLVLSKNGELLYNGVKEVLEKHLQDCVYSSIMDKEKIASVDSNSENIEVFLRSIRFLWSEHVTAMLMIKDVLMYVDKVYVRNTQQVPVYNMGMNVFRDIVLLSSELKLNESIYRALLIQIHRERLGEDVDRSTLQGVVNMLMDLQEKDQIFTVYKHAFEPLLLSETESYYHKQSAIRIKELGAPDYVRATKADIDSEVDRAESYLSLLSAGPLKDTVLKELIETRAEEILNIEGSGISQILDQQNRSALKTLYDLYSQIPSAVKTLQKSLHKHICMLGDRINKLLDNALNDNKTSSDTSSSTAAYERQGTMSRTTVSLHWVQKMLDLYDIYDKFFHDSFSKSTPMRNTINDAFIVTINQNSRAPELLSLYIDSNLKKGLKGRSDAEVDHVLERSVLMFRFLKSKDTFEHYYKLHLARRLLSNRSISDDAEKSLVAKLKVECGSQFTLKLEGMFKDMELSAELSRSLKESRKLEDINFDMNISVLTPTFWPSLLQTNARPAEDVSAPATQTSDKLTIATDSFSEFYLSRHSGRRLAWQYSMGTADLKIHFSNSIHELNVSTYQMIILLLFADTDDKTELTTEQIEDKTHIPMYELKRQLQSLACAKYKILNKIPRSREVDPKDLFAFNYNFHVPQYRVRIPLISMTTHIETDKEKAESQTRISQERQYLIEAAIVRIMKDRKKMLHENLVHETISQLSSRFLPVPKMIKEVIGKLIDREYLQRSSEDPKLYLYLA